MFNCENDFTITSKLYYDELKKYNPISRDAEKELLKKAKNGDDRARNKLFESHLRLVYNNAVKLKGRGVSMDDLVAEGNLGLFKAFEKFDMTMDTKFSTYAVWWIKNAMYDAIKKRRIEIVNEQAQSKFGKAEDRLMIDADDREMTMNDVINSGKFEGNLFEAVDMQGEVISILLGNLDNREREIVEMYYGIDRDGEMNLEEIGKSLGITRERVRQIKNTAIKKLRANILLLGVADDMFN